MPTTLRDPLDIFSNGSSRSQEDDGPIETPEEGKILGFVGRKREGKSLSAGALCYEAYCDGWEVAHNGSLKFGELLDVDKLIHLGYENYFIFLDEVHTWLDPRRGMTLLAVMSTAYLTQVGKLNNFLIWATHRLGLVDLRLREATDLLIEVHKDKIMGPRTLHWFIKDINGVYSEPGTERTAEMHDMHLYFPVLDTRSLFAYQEGGKTREQLQQERRYKEAQAVAGAIEGFRQAGYDRITPMQISELIKRDLEMTIDSRTVGRYLGDMGLAPKKIGSNRFYFIDL